MEGLTDSRVVLAIWVLQEIGWKPWAPKPPEHGLRACEETRIAEGQILGPRHP